MVAADKSQKILMLLNCPLIGGAEIYSLTLAEGLQKRGHSIYAACNNTQLNSMLRKAGIRVFHLRWGKKVGGVRSPFLTVLFSPVLFIYFFILLSFFKIRFKTTVLHVQFLTEKFCATPAARLLGYRVIWTEHGKFTEWMKNKFIQKLYVMLSVLPDKIIAVSEFAKHDFIEMGVNDDKLIVIYNGIDLVKFNPEISGLPVRKEFGISEKDVVVGLICRLSSDRHMDYFFYQIPKILKVYPEVKFLIVGDGDDRIKFEKIANFLGIQSSVIFTGYREDMNICTAAMDIGVSASLHKGEGLALRILEAQACGKPYVSIAVGGIPEIILNGKTGRLINFDSKDDLYTGIVSFMRNSDERKSMGERAARHIAENFNLNDMIIKTEKVMSGA